VVYGWFSSLIYIAGLSAINSNQKKGNAVAVNAAFQFSGSAGAFTGVLSGGILMQIMGSSGFIVTIALSSLTYLTINFLTIYNEKN
jgi:hypothetical protein